MRFEVKMLSAFCLHFKRTSLIQSDCGDTYTLNNGYVNFTGHATTYNEEVPVMCNEGYEIEGDPKIKCLATGAWSQDTACRAKPAEGKLQL